jgi:hypothetical protein
MPSQISRRASGFGKSLQLSLGNRDASRAVTEKAGNALRLLHCLPDVWNVTGGQPTVDKVELACSYVPRSVESYLMAVGG